ncbi:hypothetical protein [Anditalea andensis]|uniref:Plasmid stabilization protein n=1 Tax=Anditalea andensis TaxID=1048983 RepID=A0A074L4C1_9BACT|nr:hypothetical protein [Anditalea andensis]KEO74683.1 hypothetical protein EL17_03120 [Anditalea andensis]
MVSLEKALEIGTQLLNKVDSLSTDPHIGQYEEYPEHLINGQRRLMEGDFKTIYLIEDVYVDIRIF